MSDLCATGCRITGTHLDTCTDGACRGCYPRPADTGTLCAWCWKTLTEAVDALPGLSKHLRAIGAPFAQSKPATDDVVAPGDPAEGSVLPAAWLFEDEMASTVASWAHVIVEEHPNQPMRGPNASPWNGDVASWLTPHLPWCAGQEWAAEMRREIITDVTTARFRWPTLDDTEAIRRVDVPCPRCDQLSLRYTPPREAHTPFVVQCDNPDCVRVFNEDEWERFRMLALDIHADRPQETEDEQAAQRDVTWSSNTGLIGGRA